MPSKKNTRIHHECEGRIENLFWRHKACRVMTSGDCEGRSFLSHPPTNNGLCFLLTILRIPYNEQVIVFLS